MTTDDHIDAGTRLLGRCRSPAEACWIETVVIVSRAGYVKYQPLCPSCQQPLIMDVSADAPAAPES